MSDVVYDAAIVGGGPAGCSAAITLAQRGARVVLYEAKTYPHHKVCGEFLSPECGALLDQLNVSLTTSRPVAIQTACITAPDGTLWAAQLPGIAWGISRSAFDATMAEHATALGVEIREANTVTHLHGNLPRGFTIEARTSSLRQVTRARTVIAAYGKRNGLDRTLNRSFLDHPQPYIALKAHFVGLHLPGRIELHTFPGGYCGMSEIENGIINICLLAHESVFRRATQSIRPDVESFIAWIQIQNPLLRDRLSQARRLSEQWLSIAQIPFVSKAVVERDILLAGDAAGLIVPLAGDGIAMALQSGRLAALHTAKFLHEEWTPTELKQNYQDDWQREFGRRLRLGRMLQAIMLRPRLLTLGLRVLNTLPPLGDYLVRNTRNIRLVNT